MANTPSTQRGEMISIYKSLDWNLYEHLVQADSIARTMMSEMSTCGVPAKMYIPFVQEKFCEMIERISREAEEQAIPRRRRELKENAM